jgi:hypothetical protein
MIGDSAAALGEAFLAEGVHRIDVVASASWGIRIPGAKEVH